MTDPSKTPSIQPPNKMSAEKKMKGLYDRTDLKPGWYVADKAHDYIVYRGPFKHSETAVAVRAEMERYASDRMNEHWNLACCELKAKGSNEH